MFDVADLVNSLTQKGYRDSFTIDRERLHLTGTDRWFEPDEVTLDVLERFEGDSNPAEETLVLGLSANDGTARGTLVTSYPLEGEALRLLMEHARFEHGGYAQGSSKPL
jgi:hypothetical protein